MKSTAISVPAPDHEDEKTPQRYDQVFTYDADEQAGDRQILSKGQLSDEMDSHVDFVDVCTPSNKYER